jgi:hypothetical protein
MFSNAWDNVCTGTSAYFDVLFPGEGLDLFKIEPSQSSGGVHCRRSRHSVASAPVPEREKAIPTAVGSNIDSALDGVLKSTSAYLDVLFPSEGSEAEVRPRHLGKRHTIASFPAPEWKTPAVAVVSNDGNAAPSFLEAYFELLFPGEGLNVFHGRQQGRPGIRHQDTVASGASVPRRRVSAPSLERVLQSSANLSEVSTSVEIPMPLKMSATDAGSPKGEPGSATPKGEPGSGASDAASTGHDSESTVSASGWTSSDGIYSRSSDNSLASHDDFYQSEEPDKTQVLHQTGA